MEEIPIWKNLSLEDLPGEEWREVDGYSGYYQVSSFGRVKKRQTNQRTHWRPIICKQCVGSRGYWQVSLDYKTVQVHRVLAKAFTPNPHNKPFINHIDGNKLNNALENLEWCTHIENCIHAKSNGLIASKPQAKPVIQLTMSGDAIREWNSGGEAAKFLGVSPTVISGIATGKIKNSKHPFRWKFK